MVLETTAGGSVFLAGRLVSGLVLAFMGLNHFLELEGMSGYAAAKGIPAPRMAVIVSGGMLIGGGVSLAIGIVPVLGAAVIARFFLAVTPLMHEFWSVEDPEQRQGELTHFLKNATLFGAPLVFVAIGGTAWPYALTVGL